MLSPPPEVSGESIYRFLAIDGVFEGDAWNILYL
jgi:hypothetical protein